MSDYVFLIMKVCEKLKLFFIALKSYKYELSTNFFGIVFEFYIP